MRPLVIGLAALTLALAGCGKKQAPQAPGNTGTAADPAATPTKTTVPANPCAAADEAEGTIAPPAPDGADPCSGGE